MKPRYVIGIAAVLLAFAAFVPLSPGNSIETPTLDVGAVTKIEVFVHGGLKPYREINDSAELAKLVAFVNLHRTGWSKPLFEGPMPQVIVWFFVGTRQERGFGAGSNFFWTLPNLSQEASREDRKRFMEVLGLDEALLNP